LFFNNLPAGADCASVKNSDSFSAHEAGIDKTEQKGSVNQELTACCPKDGNCKES
jgi:hypothetical protein